MIFTLLKIYSKESNLCTVIKFVEHKQKLFKVFVTYLIPKWAPLVILHTSKW